MGGAGWGSAVTSQRRMRWALRCPMRVRFGRTYPPPAVRRAARPRECPAERVERFRRMIESGEVRNRAELARRLGCSRAWISKVLGRAAVEAPLAAS